LRVVVSALSTLFPLRTGFLGDRSTECVDDVDEEEDDDSEDIDARLVPTPTTAVVVVVININVAPPGLLS